MQLRLTRFPPSVPGRLRRASEAAPRRTAPPSVPRGPATAPGVMFEEVVPCSGERAVRGTSLVQASCTCPSTSPTCQGQDAQRIGRQDLTPAAGGRLLARQFTGPEVRGNTLGVPYPRCLQGPRLPPRPPTRSGQPIQTRMTRVSRQPNPSCSSAQPWSRPSSPPTRQAGQRRHRNMTARRLPPTAEAANAGEQPSHPSTGSSCQKRRDHHHRPCAKTPLPASLHRRPRSAKLSPNHQTHRPLTRPCTPPPSAERENPRRPRPPAGPSPAATTLPADTRRAAGPRHPAPSGDRNSADDYRRALRRPAAVFVLSAHSISHISERPTRGTFVRSSFGSSRPALSAHTRTGRKAGGSAATASASIGVTEGGPPPGGA